MVYLGLPSGEQPHFAMERSPPCYSWENNHDFDWAIFHSKLLVHQRVSIFQCFAHDFDPVDGEIFSQGTLLLVALIGVVIHQVSGEAPRGVRK